MVIAPRSSSPFSAAAVSDGSSWACRKAVMRSSRYAWCSAVDTASTSAKSSRDFSPALQQRGVLPQHLEHPQRRQVGGLALRGRVGAAGELVVLDRRRRRRVGGVRASATSDGSRVGAALGAVLEPARVPASRPSSP